MTSLRTLQICGLAALAVGVTVASFSNRAPKRGWIGVVLLLVASLAWASIESGESLPMLATYLLVAPIAVVYPFRARRAAPDRFVALAAFAGSFVVAVFLLFTVAGLVYSLIAL
jgi:hypothetical membrane protein